MLVTHANDRNVIIHDECRKCFGANIDLVFDIWLIFTYQKLYQESCLKALGGKVTQQNSSSVFQINKEPK